MATVPDLSGNAPADEPPYTQATIYSKMKFDNQGNLLVSSGSGTSSMQMQGTGASDATAVGNPNLIAGLVNTSTPAAATTGQAKSVWVGNRGSIASFITDQSGAVTVALSLFAGTALASTLRGLNTNAVAYAWDGATSSALASVPGAIASGAQTLAVHKAPTTSVNAGIALTATTVAAGSLVLKASAGNLYGINITAGASAGYLMIFNATSAPADGTVTPIFCMAVAANASLAFQWDTPVVCSAGITAVFSTTGPFTKTISATAFISGMAK